MSTQQPGGERRAVALLSVIGLLVAIAVADFVVPEPRRDPRVEAGVTSAAPAGAVSSTWYCAISTAKPGGEADGEVIIANPSSEPVRGRVTAFPTEGESRSRSILVGPAGRIVVRPRELVEASYAAAMVELDRGGVVVEHGVSGPLGFDLAPCATAGSQTWHLAEGATTKTSTMLLGLFNPFPEDAIVDIAFTTDQGIDEEIDRQGRVVPADLQGVVVPPRSLVVRNVGDHVRRRETVATSVVARSGRLVVEKLQLRNDPGQRGLALSLAAPRASTVWHFPEGVAREGVVERFHVYNPTSREARVDLELTLDEGVVEPFEIPVPPLGRVTLVANEEEAIPKGVGHSAIVRTLNGVPVVVERSFDATSGRQGRTSSLGALEPARAWVLAAGVATSGVEEWVVVQNPTRRQARIVVTLLRDGERIVLDRLGGLSLAAGARRGYRVNDAIDVAEGSILVESSAPVVVERALYRVGRVGISSSLGVPLRS